MPVSIDRRTVSTLCAPLGGLRPGATELAALLRRLWAPGAGVQACGSTPLTAQAPKCYAIPGAPVGAIAKAYGCTRPEAAGGTGAAAGPGRRKERDAVQLSGGIPKGGTPPFGRTFGDFSCVRKVTPAERPAARRRRNPLPFGSFRAVPKGTRPQAKLRTHRGGASRGIGGRAPKAKGFAGTLRQKDEVSVLRPGGSGAPPPPQIYRLLGMTSRTSYPAWRRLSRISSLWALPKASKVTFSSTPDWRLMLTNWL